MNDSKPWYKSMTIWCLILAFGGVLGVAVARSQGVTLTAEEKGVADSVVLALLALAGVGRSRATKQIGTPNDTPYSGVKYRETLLLCLTMTLGLALLGGCGGRADVVQTRETLYLGTRTMRAEHLTWARQLGPGGDLTKLPQLTAADVALRERWDREVEDYVAASRTHDADGGLGGLLGPTSRP